MKNSSNKGSAPLYIAVFFAILITSTAVTLGGILTNQIFAARDIISVERAFSAANAGTEATLFELRRQLEGGEFGETVDVSGSIPYEDGTEATFEAEGRLIVPDGLIEALPCVSGAGFYQDSERRIELKATEECDS